VTICAVPSIFLPIAWTKRRRRQKEAKICLTQIKSSEISKNVVQRKSQGAEGDGAAHQPDLPLPAEPVPRASLVIREHIAAHRGPHCGIR